MKKITLITILLILISFLVLSGCQKYSDLTPEIEKDEPSIEEQELSDELDDLDDLDEMMDEDMDLDELDDLELE